jgi:hypothetical protein
MRWQTYCQLVKGHLAQSNLKWQFLLQQSISPQWPRRSFLPLKEYTRSPKKDDLKGHLTTDENRAFMLDMAPHPSAAIQIMAPYSCSATRPHSILSHQSCYFWILPLPIAQKQKPDLQKKIKDYNYQHKTIRTLPSYGTRQQDGIMLQQKKRHIPHCI